MTNENMDKVQKLRYRKQKLLLAGGQDKIEKQHANHKYCARERIARLFDPGSFVETDSFITHRCHDFGMEKKKMDGDSLVAGHGTIHGRPVFAYAQDFTVIGGTISEMNVKKLNKLYQSATRAGCPVIGLFDSGGARIQEGVDILFANFFKNNVNASGVIPQISAILGSCAGGAAYSPALTDFILMVDKTSQMFIAGPKVIESVTGQKVTIDEMGSAALHNSVSGCAHFIDSSEDECFERIRTLLDYLPSNYREKAPVQNTGDNPDRLCPELDVFLPENSNRSYDMKTLIRTVADNGIFFEVQDRYAPNALTGFIRMDGQSVGVVANQPAQMAGCLDINASDKISRFIRTCDCFNIPLLTFVDVPGYLPGLVQERGGIIRHGAKVLYAYGEASIPMVTIVVRKGYGGACLAMGSRDMGADYVFAWPHAEFAVMGPEGAVNVVFRKELENAADPAARRAELIQLYKDTITSPYAAASRGYIDDIILPSETRVRIIRAFRLLADKTVPDIPRKHGNMPV